MTANMPAPNRSHSPSLLPKLIIPFFLKFSVAVAVFLPKNNIYCANQSIQAEHDFRQAPFLPLGFSQFQSPLNGNDLIKLNETFSCSGPGEDKHLKFQTQNQQPLAHIVHHMHKSTPRSRKVSRTRSSTIPSARSIQSLRSFGTNTTITADHRRSNAPTSRTSKNSPALLKYNRAGNDSTPAQFKSDAIFTAVTPNYWPALPKSSRGGAPRVLYGLSYSPFGLADNVVCPPYDSRVGGQCLLTNQVQNDMDTLSKLTTRIKTYSTVCFDASEQILRSAAKHGMTVMLGVWVSSDENLNAAEIERMSLLVANYHRIISHVMVGNEPLSTLGISPAIVADAIRKVRDSISAVAGVYIPVGVADISSVWLGENTAQGSTSLNSNTNADLNIASVVNACDWIGLNTHPYYGGVDIHTGVAATVVYESVIDIYKKYNKNVIVTETGYPTAGSGHSTAAGTAYPCLDGISTYMAAMENISRTHNVPVYFFEPYDSEWKRRWEPYDEATYHFGLATCDRRMKNITLPPPGAL